MKIVVIGGTGLIGTKVVNNLRQRGHEVVAASPSKGVNTITGEGLAEAVKGAQVVVDVANSPSFEDKPALEFFETSGRNLLAAEKAAGVKHHVALSVVGTDRLLGSGAGSLSGYFRAKMAQENLIKTSGIPFTIVHATQFFEFANGIAQSGADGSNIRLSPVLMQPILPSFTHVYRVSGWQLRRVAVSFAVSKCLTSRVRVFMNPNTEFGIL